MAWPLLAVVLEVLDLMVLDLMVPGPLSLGL
jgi:hypothetical protein